MSEHRLAVLLGSLTLGLIMSAPADAAEFVVCSALRPLDGSTLDVTPTLDACVRETDAGGVLEAATRQVHDFAHLAHPQEHHGPNPGQNGGHASGDYVDGRNAPNSSSDWTTASCWHSTPP